MAARIGASRPLPQQPHRKVSPRNTAVFLSEAVQPAAFTSTTTFPVAWPASL